MCWIPLYVIERFDMKFKRFSILSFAVIAASSGFTFAQSSMPASPEQPPPAAHGGDSPASPSSPPEIGPPSSDQGISSADRGQPSHKAHHKHSKKKKTTSESAPATASPAPDQSSPDNAPGQ